MVSRCSFAGRKSSLCTGNVVCRILASSLTLGNETPCTQQWMLFHRPALQASLSLRFALNHAGGVK
jgi:hypothetical protein